MDWMTHYQVAVGVCGRDHRTPAPVARRRSTGNRRYPPLYCLMHCSYKNAFAAQPVSMKAKLLRFPHSEQAGTGRRAPSAISPIRGLGLFPLPHSVAGEGEGEGFDTPQVTLNALARNGNVHLWRPARTDTLTLSLVRERASIRFSLDNSKHHSGRLH